MKKVCDKERTNQNETKLRSTNKTNKQTKNFTFFSIAWVAPPPSISIFERLPYPRGGWWVFFSTMSGNDAKTMSRSQFRVK